MTSALVMLYNVVLSINLIGNSPGAALTSHPSAKVNADDDLC